ncbi:hypothetical protein AVEN_126659-1 [Araneus ventricosus]|uniref:Uncharacterized protein n=1 Tax=Araneus ventricosus TaxID=182803 RepID=A0A4Y2JEX2_ARAVE|nr:hypothetical protein AVEN_126659-1 [Araneus ventricosus]
MKLMKSTSGLTRKRGVAHSGTGSLVWISPRARNLLSTLPNISVHKLLKWFHDGPPFTVNSGRMSLATGVTGDESVTKANKKFLHEEKKGAGNNFGDVKLVRKVKSSSQRKFTTKRLQLIQWYFLKETLSSKRMSQIWWTVPNMN